MLFVIVGYQEKRAQHLLLSHCSGTPPIHACKNSHSCTLTGPDMKPFPSKRYRFAYNCEHSCYLTPHKTKFIRKSPTTWTYLSIITISPRQSNLSNAAHTHTQVQFTNVYIAWLDFYSTTAGCGIETLASKHNERYKKYTKQNNTKRSRLIEYRKRKKWARQYGPFKFIRYTINK